MFLLGTWFIRSGVMENSGAHLPMFRKLAYIGLPVGIAHGHRRQPDRDDPPAGRAA